MKLLTKEVEKLLPLLYSQEKVEDPVVHVKFFDPCGSWTWLAYEGGWCDGDGKYVGTQEEAGSNGDYLFFGLVQGFEVELGYFSLKELSSVRGKMGLPLERDLYFKPVPLSQVRAKLYGVGV